MSATPFAARAALGAAVVLCNVHHLDVSDNDIGGSLRVLAAAFKAIPLSTIAGLRWHAHAHANHEGAYSATSSRCAKRT
jgi:hypothetical protein